MQLRITVLDTLDTIRVSAKESDTVAAVKRQALDEAVGSGAELAEYVAKFRGAAVNDGATLASLGVPDDGALIVMANQRRPAR